VPHKTDPPSDGCSLVEAYSRLHFGLLEIHPSAPSCFGGIGLMVDKPSVRLSSRTIDPGDQRETRAEPCSNWEDPYWKERFLKVYRRFSLRTQTAEPPIVELAFAPVPHIGLGSGTQFACAASALLNLSENPDKPTNWQDASWTLDAGRGLRSHIGLHGFLHGQMIIDRGQDASEGALGTERTTVHGFPETWRVVLLHEDVYQGDCGESEQAIFDACSKRENPNRQRMLDLTSQQILPAVSNGDFQGACEGIGLYGELAGEIFRPAVGDAYRTTRIRSWVDRLRKLGLQGVGQSSWGPVVFAIVQDTHQADWLLGQIRPEVLDGGWMYVAKAAGPARIEKSGSGLV